MPTLVVALLLCHGVFGGLHLLQGVSRVDPAAPHQPHQAPGEAGGAASVHGLLGHAGGDPAGDQEDAAGDHPFFPASGYAAVLLAALLGAVLLGRLGRVPARATGLAPWAPPGPRPLGGARPFLARGPAPPFLQIFRL